MNTKFRKSWNHCRGLTLIEVVAGMAILGTLLVSVAMATARLTKQSYLSARRVEAYQAADDLLTEWWSDLENLPQNSRGMVSGHDNWRWVTTTTDADIKDIDADLVTLEIVEADAETLILASVQFLIAAPEDEDKNGDKGKTTGSDAD